MLHGHSRCWYPALEFEDAAGLGSPGMLGVKAMALMR